MRRSRSGRRDARAGGDKQVPLVAVLLVEAEATVRPAGFDLSAGFQAAEQAVLAIIERLQTHCRTFQSPADRLVEALMFAVEHIRTEPAMARTTAYPMMCVKLIFVPRLRCR